MAHPPTRFLSRNLFLSEIHNTARILSLSKTYDFKIQSKDTQRFHPTIKIDKSGVYIMQNNPFPPRGGYVFLIN